MDFFAFEMGFFYFYLSGNSLCTVCVSVCMCAPCVVLGDEGLVKF